MKVLVSEKLSAHKYKTPEGYLICTDAILARTGKQSYTKDEIFCDGDNTEVEVDRPYDEVMNAKTIASFENKPITFDHPDEDVNVGNYKSYSVGYVRDVRQGKTDKGEDVILGNLVITDQDAINAIEQGDHTDLSCGYDCDIKDDGSGNYSQTNIRGNHLALCEQGRAGIARIVDSKVKDDETIDYKGIKIGVLHTSIGTLYEVRYNKNKADWPEYKKLENAKKYIDIFLTKGEQAANASWKIDDSVEDSKMKDDSWFKGYINGDLQSYNIDSLINNVKSKKQPLHTNLAGKSGNVYTVFIDGSLKSNVEEGSDMWIDIVVEKPDGQQKRLISKNFNSWNECQKIFNTFKNSIRDSADDITRIDDSKVEDKLSYEAASSDDNYLDDIEKMIYKFANVSVDAMLVGDKLKIAARNSKGFNSKQLNDIASVLMKNVAVSDITISNPDRFDSNVTAKIVDSKARDLVNDSEELVVGKWYEFAKKIEVARNQYAKSLRISGKSGNVYRYTIYLKNGEMYGSGTYSEIKERFNIKDSKVDSKVEDSLSKKEKELCDYMLENALDDGEDENDLLKKMKVYYSEYSNLARSKSNEVLQYFKSHIEDSKIEDVNYSEKEIKDAEYTYKLTKKKNDYDEYVIQAYKNGKKNEDATYYTDDWDDAINTLKSIAKQEKLTFRQQGSVFIADNKAKVFNESKESMTTLDAIKMLNIVDAYKKVRDASKDGYIVDRPEGAFKQISNALSSYVFGRLFRFSHDWKRKVSTTPQGIVADFTGDDKEYGIDPADMSRISTDNLKQDLQNYLQSKMQQHVVTVNSASFIKTSHGGIGGVRFRIGTKLKHDCIRCIKND